MLVELKGHPSVRIFRPPETSALLLKNQHHSIMIFFVNLLLTVTEQFVVLLGDLQIITTKRLSKDLTMYFNFNDVHI